MQQLRRTDFDTLQRIAHALYATRELDEFVETAIREVPHLVGSDLVSYQELDLTLHRAKTVVADPGVQAAHARLSRAFEKHMGQHPVARHYLEFGVDGPRKISDFVGQEEWHRNPLYCSFYRELGIECQILVPSGPTERGPDGTHIHGLNLNRIRKDFSERERALLSQLMPHLEQARSQAALIGTLQRQLRVDAFVRTRLDKNLVELDAAGRPLRIDPGAAEAFGLFFGTPSGRVPEDVQAWLASVSERQPLVREHHRDQIVVRDLGMMNGSRVLLVEASQRQGDPERLRCLGLTRREAETLYWIAQGKSNAEVAIILDIRDRTVAKHLEAVYAKLDVDSRTAATLRAIETLASALH